MVDEPGLRALCTLVARATPQRRAAAGGSPESLLFEALGLSREGDDWPVAALTAAEDGAGSRPRGWIRADPVHLQAGLNDLSFADPRELGLTREEADAVCAAINEALRGAPGRIEPLTPARWYVPLERLPRLSTREPSLAVGGPIGGMLPRGPDEGIWLRALTEIQMLLHDHPANRTREAQGRPVVNSVWFWGAGRLPPRPEAPPRTHLWSDAVLARGIGRVLGAPCRALPAGAGAWLDSAREAGRHLVYCDALHYAARLADWPAWLEALRRWEADWFEPLRRALWSGELGCLRIEAGDGVAYEIPASARWRWWRRGKPLPAPWAGGAAAHGTPGVGRAVQDPSGGRGPGDPAYHLLRGRQRGDP